MMDLEVEFELDDTELDDESLAAQDNKKNTKGRRKRVKKKKPARSSVNNQIESRKEEPQSDAGSDTEKDQIEIEVVPEEIELDKAYAELSKVFEYFKFGAPKAEIEKDEKTKAAEAEAAKAAALTKEAQIERLKARLLEDEEDEKSKENADNKPKLSKRKLKLASRLSVAALKQLVNRPDVVEMHDTTANDPKLLVHIKATRNTVPVPRHWNAKRKYLQGKRGFEKPPFELPEYIKRTGIQTMREAVQEKDEGKSLKQKMREKARPKVGRIDIDYQKLHDAFFKWQTKPRMTIHGDLYYEGKELELKLKEKKPGNLSDDLRTALGMPTGPNADKVPPPWLIAMQRYGPPPSYPNLKIPGLNAPIPEGCSFGYHAGGWGKPPVDEFGRPLYGDVFGTTLSSLRKPEEEENIDSTLWGEMEEDLYEEVAPDEDEEAGEEDEEGKEGDEEESEETGGEDRADDGLKTPGEGLITPSGTATTVSAGLETPDMIELRKRRLIEAEMEMSTDETPVLYKILPEKATNVGASMMGSSKVYDISAAKKIAPGDDVELSFNPDELASSELLPNLKTGQETADLVKNSKRKKESKPAADTETSEKDKKRKKEFKF